MESKNTDTANAVTFDNDAELQTENRRTTNAFHSVKDRASLSKSSKAWDIDGDGELDEAELALKTLDQKGAGTLSKDQMYLLMQDNFKMQRDIFKVKKVVIGLAAFTCVLALSNFATAFAAAFLAKDTKSYNDNLIDAKTGRTLATQTTAATFTIDPEFNELHSRHLEVGSIAHFVTYAEGEEIVDDCELRHTVTILRKFSGKREVKHNICPGGSTQKSGDGGLSIFNADGSIIVISPTVDGKEYSISGLTGGFGRFCDVNEDCTKGLVCDIDGLTCISDEAETVVPKKL